MASAAKLPLRVLAFRSFKVGRHDPIGKLNGAGRVPQCHYRCRHGHIGGDDVPRARRRLSLFPFAFRDHTRVPHATSIPPLQYTAFAVVDPPEVAESGFAQDPNRDLTPRTGEHRRELPVPRAFQGSGLVRLLRASFRDDGSRGSRSIRRPVFTKMPAIATEVAGTDPQLKPKRLEVRSHSGYNLPKANPRRLSQLTENRSSLSMLRCCAPSGVSNQGLRRYFSLHDEG